MREYIKGTTVSPKFDLRVGATEHEVDTILGLIVDYNIFNFVEIGVHEGGLTEHLLSSSFCNYLGIEINDGIVSQSIKNEIEEMMYEIIYSDCMTNSTIDKVRTFLNKAYGRSIVYCDNGSKKDEIVVYSKIVETGNILLTHDFSDGIRKVRGVEDYSAAEVVLEDIKFMENDPTFERLPEEMLCETRLVGWIKK